MNLINQQIKQIELREAIIKSARLGMSDFAEYMHEDYSWQWFHIQICEMLDSFLKGKKNKVMVFLPPQHSKSTLSSILFPAYALGIDPKLKIGVMSYSKDLAQAFNRKCQQTIESIKYQNVFPDTKLNSTHVSTDTRKGVLRNMSIFEIIEHRGYLKTVGVGGSLTGTALDIAIIDDPFKDRLQAESETYRNNVWNWYTDVVLTRLDKRKRQIMLFTRWHEDDLAGRIEADEKEWAEWEIIKFPAIKDEDLPNDPRQIGEALWEEKHSKESILKVQERSPRTFESLYQQRPAPLDGGIIKTENFEVVEWKDVIELPINWNFYHDGAYTDNTKNDPSATGSFGQYKGDLYIRHIESKWVDSADLLEYIEKYVNENGYNFGSMINIEPKASGKTTVSSIKKHTRLNVKEYKFPKQSAVNLTNDKFVRVSAIIPFLQSGRVKLIRGDWNKDFLKECAYFPNGKHDDKIDCLVMACMDVIFAKQGLSIKRQSKR